MRSKPTCGFTIIELMVAVAVLALLAAMAIPSLQNTIKNNRIVAQGNELTAMLNFARNEALRRNASVPVELTAGTNSWSGEVRDPLGAGADPCTAQGALRCGEFEQVALSGNISLVFNNRGYLTPFEPVTFSLQHENCSGARQRRLIRVLPSGQVDTCTAECDEDCDF